MPTSCEWLDKWKSDRSHNRRLVGVAAGSGLTARCAKLGGADFILALSAGRFRQMGFGSLAGFLPYANSNALTMQFATRELLSASGGLPVFFGLDSNDPTLTLEDYLEQIHTAGFAGINNFPSVGLIDGSFREAIEASGISYTREVHAIRIAHMLGMMTVAFIFNHSQAQEMAAAGADILCLHLGLTGGGALGAKKLLSLKHAKELADTVFADCTTTCIKMIYGGPVNHPADLQFMYADSELDGYIGGSAFERIPAEHALLNSIQSFKLPADDHYQSEVNQLLAGPSAPSDYITFLIDYIHHHYMEPITLQDLALVLCLSRAYLSTLFKQRTGFTFSDYLINYRLKQAIKMLHSCRFSVSQIAAAVGYPDVYQFSKIFKKRIGASPKKFLQSNINTK
ncbi:MAG: phosphoenolpyruvate hydrolase family protein [Sporolactobacillus sp.]